MTLRQVPAAGKGEDAALSEAAANVDASSVRVCDVRNDGEAQAGAWNVPILERCGSGLCPLISPRSPLAGRGTSCRAPRGQDRYAGRHGHRIRATGRIAVQPPRTRSISPERNRGIHPRGTARRNTRSMNVIRPSMFAPGIV